MSSYHLSLYNSPCLKYRRWRRWSGTQSTHRAAGKEQPDDLGHRIRTGGMSDEDLAAFFKANPERAVEMAKIATSFQGAAEKVPGPAAANNATANSKRRRERARVGDVVAAADFTDADDDDSIDPSPSQLRKKSRGASPSSSQLRRKSSGAGPSSSRQDTKPARGAWVITGPGGRTGPAPVTR